VKATELDDEIGMKALSVIEEVTQDVDNMS
jgi:hypothetical protein